MELFAERYKKFILSMNEDETELLTTILDGLDDSKLPEQEQYFTHELFNLLKSREL